MKVVLISTYELGRQPFGLASPAAWLREAGAHVTCLDLSRSPLHEAAVRAADLVAFYVPMHTATRLAANIALRVRQMNPGAHLCFYGLYAVVNETYLRDLGADTILGGEYEQGLLTLVKRLDAAPKDDRSPVSALDSNSASRCTQPEPLISTERQQFRVPDRDGLPGLERYARVDVGIGEPRITGYTEASRGCKYFCRHCPIVPVYQGRFRIVQREVVLQDVRQQVAAGASHITFGDPDFFNGPGHSLAIVEALHREYPSLTYDVTIKVEHLLKYAHYLSTLRDTGCILVTSAAEAIDDRVLQILDKRHTRADFVRAVELLRRVGLNLAPTFVTFTPWTTVEGYFELLSFLAETELIQNVAPIQLAIRLLIPAGSKLLELDEVRKLIGPFNDKKLSYEWKHSDPRVEELYQQARFVVSYTPPVRKARWQAFLQVWNLARATAGKPCHYESDPLPPRATVPYLNESWFC
ncbi:MAG: radical SAM protein [Acidobacteria bacterium]|nr:radical SAM protein [Acidobacteriota bacterium]